MQQTVVGGSTRRGVTAAEAGALRREVELKAATIKALQRRLQVQAAEITRLRDEVSRATAGLPPTDALPSAERVFGVVAAHFMLDPRVITHGRTHHWELSQCRQFAWWILRRVRPDITLKGIGRICDGRDHTTVHHGIKRVEQRLADPENEGLRRVARDIVVALVGKEEA